MKNISLLDCVECPCPGTHHAACVEFIDGFTDFGYFANVAKNIEECRNKDILLLSSHIINVDFLNKLNEINPDAVYILWFYHSVLNKIPFKKFILTSEYYHKTPRLESHKPYDLINKSIVNFVPLMLRVNESPEKIGLYSKTNEINGCFMGTAYKKDWVAELQNIVYHDISHGLLNYEQRRDVYLKSTIAFGFTSNENIQNYHPTQRIFEGLAYGCVVISDNEAAGEMTNGIVVCVNTKEEFLEKYNYYLYNPEECRKKEKDGYEWAKKYGTNRYSAKLFLDKIKELNY